MTTKKGTTTYAAALKQARKELASLLKGKASAEAILAHAATEIPRLESIIRAMGGQVKTTPILPRLPHAPVLVDGVPVVREVDESMGSIPAVPGPDGPAVTPDINSLPGMAEEGWT